MTPGEIQDELLETLRVQGDAALHEAIQHAWPLDARAAFGAIPTPLRLHADPRFRGRGVTVAFVDSGFHPHPDLVAPVNRIRVWADAGRTGIEERRFARDEPPRWPGWDASAEHQWHGTMTSTSACGNGSLSGGLYRGLASEAEVVLVQARDERGRITTAAIERALRWIEERAEELGISVVSLSCAGDAPEELEAEGPLDAATRRLVERGIVVVAAAGNEGLRRLVPPASSPWAITVGGIDDKNTFDHGQLALWHSSYGATSLGGSKPDLTAPSLWVAAPLLPGSAAARDAAALFARRFPGGAGTPDPMVEAEIAARRLVTPHYQHVEGTSFAAPLVSSVVACMLEANPELSPALVRDALLRTAHPVPGVGRERQGSGVVEAGRAIAAALGERHASPLARHGGPLRAGATLTFRLHDHRARRVEVWGSWDGWGRGVPGRQIEPGLWCATIADPGGGQVYKFLVDGGTWLDDPGNPRKAPDGRGGLNSVVSGS